MDRASITTLFIDIGGVLLTNGWDRLARQQAADNFQLNYADIEERHHLTYDTYEEGKLSLDEYLNRVIFYEKRSFSADEFKSFMYSRSQPYDEMIALVRSIKAHYPLKIITVSNEGREINDYRIHKFKLAQLIDTFILSCFVHYRKPDPDIYRIALDVCQSTPDEVAYIEDRPLFVEVANSLGIYGIRHIDASTTASELAKLGILSNQS